MQLEAFLYFTQPDPAETKLRDGRFEFAHEGCLDSIDYSRTKVGPVHYPGLKIMKKFTTLALATAMLFSPAISFAGQTSPTPLPNSAEKDVQLKNVQLKAGGSLVGQFVSEAGQPVADVKIAVKMGKVVKGVQTDAKGRFELTGLKGGRAFFHVGEEVYAAQLWAEGTAPPNSISTLALVKSDGVDTVRGQNGRFLGRIASLTPTSKALLGIAAIGGVAVAIAVAADNDDDAS